MCSYNSRISVFHRKIAKRISTDVEIYQLWPKQTLLTHQTSRDGAKYQTQFQKVISGWQ